MKQYNIRVKRFVARVIGLLFIIGVFAAIGGAIAKEEPDPAKHMLYIVDTAWINASICIVIALCIILGLIRLLIWVGENWNK